MATPYLWITDHLGRFPLPLLNLLLSLLIALILGFLAGIGVGGGSLLLLWLTQVSMIPQSQAKLINLLFYLPAAIISSIFHYNKEQPDKSLIIPGIIAGCIGAFCFSLISQYTNPEFLKKFLGGLLIILGLREVFYRPRNAK